MTSEPSTRPTVVWAFLFAGMAASAAWLLLAGRGITFNGDDLYYYASYVAQGGFETVPTHGLEYFLAPHNGHLQVLGKLVYQGLFETVGADYFFFRVVETAAVLTCVGLFFELARRRVGPIVALAPSLLLLFLGYGYETLLWAFDMHTVLALAFGLAALIFLERGDRRGDRAACALLVLSLASIELGIAFAIGAAVSILPRGDRWQRAWVFLVPVVLYASWWVWARQFEQSAIDLLNVHQIPIDVSNALAAVAGSLFGLNPTGPEVTPQLTGVTAWGTVIAGAAVLGLIARFRRGGIPATLWVHLAIVATYWAMIALADRPPDSSRYIFVGSILVLLIAADAARGVAFSTRLAVVLFGIVAIAIPPNLAKFYDGRRLLLDDASASRTEYAMLEAARDTVNGGYAPGNDPRVTEVGGGVSTALPAGDYLRAADEFGSLAFTLQEVREEDLIFRQVADATSLGALEASLTPTDPPRTGRRCTRLEGAPDQGDTAILPNTEVLLGSRAERSVEIYLSRFADDGFGIHFGPLAPDSWARLEITADRAPDRWRILVDGPVDVCPPAARRGGSHRGSGDAPGRRRG